jgi:menaquinol-cytochrome c reductase iron-sulfur subunit
MNEEANLSRKKFLERLTLSLLGGAAVVSMVPFMASLFGPLLKKTDEVWRKVGKATSFKTGTTVLVTYEDADPVKWAGTTAQTGAWLRKISEEAYEAFAINCSHLGCPVRWQENSSLFLCPCHGGVYYKDGTVASGPPPKPLTKYLVRIQDGDVEILTHPTPITTLK